MATKTPDRFSLSISLGDDHMARYLTTGLDRVLADVRARVNRDALEVGWRYVIRDENGNRIGEAVIE